MLKIRKYIALGIVFLPLFLFRFIAANFVIENGEQIYTYVPIEADVIIELNTRNFIKEIAYQRVFNEDYFKRKVYPPTDEPQEPLEIVETGINFFDRIIVFRETWSTEKVWALVVPYTNKKALEKFARENFADSKLFFSENDFVIIQLTNSLNIDAVDEHFTKLANRNIKPITEKVDLQTLFSRDKEVNCYFSPQASTDKNQIIDGHISFDFVGDEISIQGSFNPVSDFDKNATIAYSLNKEVAFSMRSSLNLFHSIYWFGNERIEGLPQYDQLAFDYDGVDMILMENVNEVQFPFKSFPDLQLHMQINNPAVWQSYLDTLANQENYRIDTTTKMLVTDQNAYFKYNLTHTVFELMREEINLAEDKGDSVFVAIHLNAPDLLGKTRFSIEVEKEKDAFKNALIISGAEFFLDQMKDLTVMSHLDFYLSKRGGELIASGKIEMQEKGGQSMIECLFLGTGALMMLQEYM